MGILEGVLGYGRRSTGRISQSESYLCHFPQSQAFFERDLGEWHFADSSRSQARLLSAASGHGVATVHRFWLSANSWSLQRVS